MTPMFKRYLRGVDAAVESTPSQRNRVVDGWRVLALFFVVFGHWISASIWVLEDGTIRALNTLQWIPGAEHWTWLFQVMPIFFIVGGYANAVALRKEGVDHRRWIVGRARRLYTPVVPLILVWVLLVLALRPHIPSNVLYTGTLSATIPLWFVAVYLAVIALAPITHAWWERSGPVSALVLALAAVAVDIARFTSDIEATGWANYILVWAFLHQLGYWWADRSRSGLGASPSAGALMIAAGLGALVLTTTIGWYPVAMVTIPGGGTTNMIPPTFANGLLGIAQAGLILATLGVAHRISSKRAVWRTIVAVSGSMMTIYLWHLTALSLLGAAGIFLFDGWLFSFEPGSVTWWLMRIPFFMGLAAVTLGLIAIFGRFEYLISDSPRPRSWAATIIGLMLAIGAASAMAFVGIVNQEGTIAWATPVVAISGAIVLGAVPRKRDRQSKIEEKPGPSGSFS
jgi:surface polysaccharide O-acyltransferase-like enzyme